MDEKPAKLIGDWDKYPVCLDCGRGPKETSLLGRMMTDEGLCGHCHFIKFYILFPEEYEKRKKKISIGG